MARQKKVEEKKGAAWLVTFSDLMTLLLTFFVLLLSMATIDERRVRNVLFTVRGSLGIGATITTPLSDLNKPKEVVPGAFDMPSDDLEPLREMLWEDQNQDITLQSNRFLEIISINADVLFAAGETSLTPRGQQLLNRLIPVLKKLDYPMLLAGHASPTRDEIQVYRVTLDPHEFSPTWEISFLRIMSMYTFFKSAGLPGDKMMVEGFGEYRPKASNNTAFGREANRRVDIVLDKRGKLKDLPQGLGGESEKTRPTTYEQGGFVFDVTPPAKPQE